MTLSTELNLTPLAKTILYHLRKRGSISPVEAMIAYHTMRLADAIYRLRKAGYRIESVAREDEVGNRYTRYKMMTAAKAH